MKFSARNIGLLLAITITLTSFPAFAPSYAMEPGGSQGSKTVPIKPVGTGTDIPQTPAEPTPVGGFQPTPKGGSGGDSHLQIPTGSPNETGGLNGQMPTTVQDCPDCGGEFTGGPVNPQLQPPGQEISRNSRPGNHKPGNTTMIAPVVSGYNLMPTNAGAAFGNQSGPNPNVMPNTLAVPGVQLGDKTTSADNTTTRKFHTTKGSHIPAGQITTRVGSPSIGTIHSETKPTPPLQGNVVRARQEINKGIIQNLRP